MEIVHLDSLGCHATGPIVAAVRYYLAREYHARKVRYPPTVYGMYVSQKEGFEITDAICESTHGVIGRLTAGFLLCVRSTRGSHKVATLT